MRKYIITGSEGLLGSVIADYYEKKRVQVVRVDKKLGHDLTKAKQVQALISTNPDANGLVVCHATNPQPSDNAYTPFNLPLKSFDAYLSLNLISVYSLVREFAAICPHNSSVVLFGSTYGMVSPRPTLYEAGFLKHPGYTISKAGIIGMTKWLAVHLAPNPRINCIAPGGVYNNQDEEFVKRYSTLTPLGRMMKKEEITGPVDFLLSDNSSYMTGSILVYDGGFTSV